MSDNGIALASPLGGAGFGMATFTIGFAYSGLISVSEGLATGIMMALFFAGMAQLIAGVLEFGRGVHILGFIHGSYGAWGIGHGILVILTMMGILPTPSASGFAIYWVGWGIVTLILMGGCWALSKYFAFVLAWLAGCFFLFAGGMYNTTVLHIAGGATVIVGLLAWYAVAAFSINESWDREVLPIA